MIISDLQHIEIATETETKIQGGDDGGGGNYPTPTTFNPPPARDGTYVHTTILTEESLEKFKK